MQKRVRLEKGRNFPNIDSSTWEHPDDKTALTALKKIPGLDKVLKFTIGSTTEKALRLYHMASAVRVSNKQFPFVKALVTQACKTLDIDHIPEVYITQDPDLNAFALGVNDPFMVIHSSMLESLTQDELLGVIGHELGHIASGHMLYKTLLYILLHVSISALNIPLSGIAISGIVIALKNWDRKSELSADRASLLVTQDLSPINTTLMKLAGGTITDHMDLNEFIKQAEEYAHAGTALDNFYKLLNLLGETHPFPVMRVTEIMQWEQSDTYSDILNGNYRERPAGKSPTAPTDFADLKQSLSAGLKEGQEKLGKVTNNLKGSASHMVHKANSLMGSFIKRK